MGWGPILRALYDGPRGPASAVVNPYRDEMPGLDRPGAGRRRRRHLEAYLEAVGKPWLLLIGEALGYRGGRFSGIAFTSERQLAGQEGERLPWAQGRRMRPTSLEPRPFHETSATIVWRGLGGDPRGVLLWNAFPWHPQGERGALSNRRPEPALLRANLHVLERLLAAFPAAQPAAVGRTAQAALAWVGCARFPHLRHPARGGAARFCAGLAGVLGSCRPKLRGAR